jgi:hypothetical protein
LYLTFGFYELLSREHRESQDEITKKACSAKGEEAEQARMKEGRGSTHPIILGVTVSLIIVSNVSAMAG